MKTRRQRDELAAAWSEVKVAVHAYARDQSSRNKGSVEAACRRLRHAEAVSTQTGRRPGSARRRLPLFQAGG